MIGLGVYCVAQFASHLLGTLAPSLDFATALAPDWLVAWRPSPVPQNAMLAFLAGLIALAGAPVMAVLRRPGIDAMARAADRRFAFDDCMSTALEVSAAPARWTGIVAQALLQHAGARSAEVDARRLVPLRLPQAALGVPFLAAAAILLTYLPPPPLLQVAYTAWLPAAVAPSPPDEQREEVAANLRAVAAILKQDGEARADPAIQAIARALDQLGNDMAADAATDGEALAQELARLAALAQDAYARAGEAAGTARNLSRLIATKNDAAPNRPTGAMRYATAPTPGQARNDLPPADNPMTAVLTNRDFAGMDDYKDLVAPATALGDPRENRTEGGDGMADAVGAVDGYDDFLATYGAEGADAARGGKLIGGADDAAPGDFAGVGTQPLFGRPTAPGGQYDIAGEFLLRNAGLGGGRRIRFDLAPPTELRTVEGGAPGATGGWRAIPEGEVTRVDLPAPARDVVSRYFEALRLGNGK